MKNLLKYYHTLRHLRWPQVFYRLYYLLRRHTPWQPAPARCDLDFEISVAPVVPFLPAYNSFQKGKFTFLNLEYRFSLPGEKAPLESLVEKIDWDFAEHGKLFSYNLNYFEFLNQPGMNPKTGNLLIDFWIARSPALKTGWEPYPICLRSINWIKHFVRNKKPQTERLQSLYSQLDFLTKNLEYHLLGNHLLENGFALVFGGLFLGEMRFLKVGQKILTAELKEQILPDGGHFELSPMYHRILLERLLDIINLIGKGKTKAREMLTPGFYELLCQRAGSMCAWLAHMSFADQKTPQLNDSAEKIAPEAADLITYAKKILPRKYLLSKLPLQESGYRKVAMKSYEAIIDVGPIGPDYIPGHAHCDMLSFVLHHKKKPLVVDTGTSTYEANTRRMIERATRAHNTVALGGFEQSEIWAAFRVARRARLIDLTEEKGEISAAHTGYRKVGAIHRRRFIFDSKSFKITDRLEKPGSAGGLLENRTLKAESLIHLAPGVKPKKIAPDKIKAGGATFVFEGAFDLRLEEYFQAPEFNKLLPAVIIVAEFIGEMSCEILLGV